MPVILSDEAHDSWLRSDTRSMELLNFLNPFPPSAMRSYPVSQRVNRAQTEDAQLVEPVDPRLEATNLSLF